CFELELSEHESEWPDGLAHLSDLLLRGIAVRRVASTGVGSNVGACRHDLDPQHRGKGDHAKSLRPMTTIMSGHPSSQQSEEDMQTQRLVEEKSESTTRVESAAPRIEVKRAGEHGGEAVTTPKMSVKDLNFFYGKSHALHDISLEIPERQVTAFIG